MSRGKIGSLIVLLSIAGCAQVRLVERHASGGGVIAIPAHAALGSNRHRKKAEKLMAEMCPGGYVIDHEQEVITGQVTHTNTNVNRSGVPVLSAFGLGPTFEDQQSTVSTTDVKEWRIWFRPKNAPPPDNLPIRSSAATQSKATSEDIKPASHQATTKKP
jgi:hypothetical protein